MEPKTTDAPRPVRRRRRRASDSRRRRFLVRIAAELVVVFVGVYLAFALNESRQARDDAARAEQIRDALTVEVEDIVRNTRNVAVQVDRMMAHYDSLWAEGEHPRPIPFLEAFRVHPHMWNTAQTTGGLDLLDVPTMLRLSYFYNELESAFAQYEQLRDLSESILLSDSDLAAADFYVEGSTALRPRYQWWLSGTRSLRSRAVNTAAIGDSLLVQLGG